VSFHNCRFSNLEKGVQFPFGNIGSEFYSCGFSGNKYGVYTKDNATGGIMHAGNKYFYSGEFSGNECAVYLYNNTDGFGALCFYGTVIEANNIGIYLYIAPRVIVPVLLSGVWFEANGSAIAGSTTIDSWSGAVRTTQTLTNKSVIVDGSGGRVNQTDGFASDIWLKGQNIEYLIRDCRVESTPGFGGGRFAVDYPDNSYIMLENPTSDGGWSTGSYADYVPFVRGNMREEGGIINPGSRAFGRIFRTNQRGSKVTGYGPSRIMSASLITAATTGSGSFGLTGTVVSDGRIYSQCNEFTKLAFASTEYTALITPSSVVTTVAGWYVITLDMKVVSGVGVNVYVWNRSTIQFACAMHCSTNGRWDTFAAIGYSLGGDTFYLDFNGMNGDVTWRVSAYQMHRFDTRQEAQNFIMSNVFAES
jgi:hypothetical protein